MVVERLFHVGQTYTDVFTRLGTAAVDVIDTRYREDADDSELIERVEQAFVASSSTAFPMATVST